MKKMTAVISAVMLALCMLAGCGTVSAEKVYGKKDTNIEVKAGDRFTIQLEENPTTGYMWSVSVSDESVVKMTGDQYNDESASEGLAGAPGTHTYTFEALKAGTTQITFVYERSFEEGSAAETVVYNVTVKK